MQVKTDKLCREIGKPVEFALRISILDVDILSFSVAKLIQSLTECVGASRVKGSGCTTQETYPWDFRWLLRVSCKAKRNEHNAKRKDSDFFLHAFRSVSIHLTATLAPSHLIT